MQKLQTVQSGHLVVSDHQVHAPAFQILQCLLSIPGLADPESIRSQAIAQFSSNHGLIVHNQNVYVLVLVQPIQDADHFLHTVRILLEQIVDCVLGQYFFPQCGVELPGINYGGGSLVQYVVHNFPLGCIRETEIQEGGKDISFPQYRRDFAQFIRMDDTGIQLFFHIFGYYPGEQLAVFHKEYILHVNSHPALFKGLDAPAWTGRGEKILIIIA